MKTVYKLSAKALHSKRVRDHFCGPIRNRLEDLRIVLYGDGFCLTFDSKNNQLVCDSDMYEKPDSHLEETSEKLPSSLDLTPIEPLDPETQAWKDSVITPKQQQEDEAKMLQDTRHILESLGIALHVM